MKLATMKNESVRFVFSLLVVSSQQFLVLSVNCLFCLFFLLLFFFIVDFQFVLFEFLF